MNLKSQISNLKFLYRCTVAVATMTMLVLAAGCAWLLMPIAAARAADGRPVAAERFELAYLEARLLITGGELDQAVARLEAARKLPGCPAAIYRALGEAYLRRKEPAKALTALEDGLKQNADDVDLMVLTARVESAADRVDRALEVLDRAGKAAPGRMSILELMSELRVKKLQGVRNQAELDAQVGELIKVYELMLKGKQGLERIPPLLILSSLYARTNRAERAVDLAREAVALQPREVRSYLTLGQGLEALGKNDEALKTYREALMLDGGNTEVRERVDKLLAAKKEEGAGRVFYGGLAKDFPEDKQLQIQYARALVADKQWDEAEPQLSRIVARWPEEAGSRLELARVWVALGRGGEAVEAVRKISAEHKAMAPLANLSLIEALLAKGERERALTLVDEFRKSGTGDDDNVLLALGTLLVETRENERAIAVLAPFVKRRPGVYGASLLLMQAYVNAKKFAAAQQVLSGLPEEVRKNRGREIQEMQAELYRRQKQWDKALAILEDLIERDPANAGLLMDTGTVYQELKRLGDAERLFRKAIELAPEDPETYNTLGYFYAETNQKLSDAEQLIAKALKMKPDAGNIMDSLGWVFFRQGKFQAAVDKLKQAVEMLGKTPDPVVYEHLGDACAKLGKLDDAREAWRKSLALDAEAAAVKEKLEKNKE